MRSRNIMSTIVLQNISALKALFKDDWEGIIGNADSFIYLGGNEQSTHKYISELLGKETIDTNTSSQSKGRNGAFSQNFQQTGRELASGDELAVLDGGMCILQLRGVRTFLPYFKHTTDNAAMIAVAGYYHYLHGDFSSLDVSPVARIEELM